MQLHRLMFDIRFKNSRTKSVNSKSTCEIFHNKNTLLIRTDILHNIGRTMSFYRVYHVHIKICF